MKTTITVLLLCAWLPASVRGLEQPGAYPQKDSVTVRAESNAGIRANNIKPPPADAQKLVNPANPGAATAGKPPAARAVKNSYVLDVSTQTTVNGQKEAAGGEQIRIKISNPMEFMAQRPADRNKLELYANDIELKGITSDFLSNVSKVTFITTDSVIWIPFTLKRDSATKAAWDILYRLTGHWYKNKARLQLSVGWEGMIPLEGAPPEPKKPEIVLTVFSNAVFIWMIISYLVLLVGLGTLVLKTDILKEGASGPFSLAQTQLAYWTILILAGFIYSLLITGIPSTMNISILTLLGISMGTTGVAKYIDYFRKSPPAGVAPAGNDLAAAPPPATPAPASSPKMPKGFWRDILGDAESINMQRFQILAWNIVLGAYFTYFTFHNKTMPVIPDVLLTLAGMSSLTYVVAKPTENRSSAAANS